jgi:glutathione synthase/RimK-type ligase-like ATP-grasp enzyme
LTILVVSSKRDGHCAPVTDVFDEVGYPWIRINTEDFATNAALSLEPTTGKGTILIRDSNRRIALSDIRAVWFRKPDPINLSHFELEQAGLDYVEAELTEVLLGIYALLQDAFWVNNPMDRRLIHRKLYQLKVAQFLGLATPPTIVSNIKDDVLKFAQDVGGDLAIKSLASLNVWSHRSSGEIIEYGLFTRRVTRDELRSVEATIKHMPTIYQAYIEKQYEIRATMVGDKCFACRIDSQSTDFGKEDYRIGTHLSQHTAYSLPTDVEKKLCRYMSVMGINFGCFDIIKSTGGEYVFLECNPNGQWLWIDEKIDAGVAPALANMLLAHARGPADADSASSHGFLGSPASIVET